MNLSRPPRADRQVDLPRTELPAEGRERYLDYLIEQITAKLENAEPGEPEMFGIEITAFAQRQQEADLIAFLQAEGIDAKLVERPRRSATPPLHWFLIKKLPVQE